MRNVDKIAQDPSNYDYSYAPIQKDYDTLRSGTREWADYFKKRMYEDFVPHIPYAVRKWVTGSDKYPESEYFRDREKGWVDHWDKKIRVDTWGLYIALADIPAIRDWKDYKKKWADRVKREGRKAWAVLTEFLKWLDSKEVTPTVEERPVEQTRIEGFQVQVVGYEDTEHDQKSMALFKEGLKIYRARATAVAPILLKQQLPLVFRYDCRLDLGGEYLRDHIDICAPWSATPKVVAKTLAHEMGHHLFKQLSGDQEKYWTTAIHQDLDDLDLHDVLAVWHNGESMWDLMDRMETHDPVLSLQLQGILHGYSQQQLKPKWHTLDELKEFLDGGGESKWVVPKHPITGYATKNSEEAFCETIGNLVAYGPQTIDPLVRSWLDTIMPGQVKAASARTAVQAVLRIRCNHGG